MKLVLEQGGKEYTDLYAYILKDDQTLMPNGVLASGSEETVYFLIDVDPDTRGNAAITFDFGVLSGKSSMDCDTSKPVANAATIETKTAAKPEGHGEFKIRSVKITKKIEPYKAKKKSQ